MKKAIFALVLAVVTLAAHAAPDQFALTASPGFWASATAFGSKQDLAYWYNLGRAYQWSKACGQGDGWSLEGKTGSVSVLSDLASRFLTLSGPGGRPEKGGALVLAQHPEKLRYTSPYPHGQKLISDEWRAVFGKGAKAEDRALTDSECQVAAVHYEEAKQTLADNTREAMRLLGYKQPATVIESGGVRVNLD